MANEKETLDIGGSAAVGRRWLSSSSEDMEKSSTPSTFVDKSAQDTDTKRHSLDGDETEMERRTSMVQALAQTYSLASRAAAPGSSPFHAEKDSPLNPAAPNFSARAWCKSIADMTTRDGGSFRSSGICFENLNVHGFGASTDYQKDMLNLLQSFAVRLTDGITGNRQRIDILREFDGVVKHGEMLVVLGPPGSGCSTFLKTIAGEMNGIFVDDDCYFNYQGISFDEMHSNHRGEAIYTAEVDVHFPQLTVGETLTFAARARQPRHLPPGVSSNEFASHFRDVTMAMYGITHTLDTRVGNEFIRGVSGGERKRVTICEATLSGAPLQCWDNSTRGLDAANAVEFCKTLRLQTELFDTSAAVSIYQAPQSAYDNFDKATVLYEGRQIFFGRADAARQYFIDLGFECPARQTTPDFLTSMTSPLERIVRPGFEGQAPRTPDEFVAAWKKSDEYKALKVEIAQYKVDHPIDGPDAEAFRASRRAQQARIQRKKSPFTLSYSQQVKLCLWRGWRRLRGDPSVTVGAIIGNSALALIVGSVFYNLPQTSSSFFLRGSFIFFACLLNAFSSALELLTLYAQRPIVEKHSRYALYHPSAEAVASMLCDLPNKIVSLIVSNLIMYFMANLNRTPGAFFFFLLMSFMALLVMSMIFRFIGSASRTLFQALIPSAILILALVIFTGFVIPFNYMLGWCRWIRWINPLNYVFESLMVNEFHGRKFKCDVFIPSKLFPEYQHVSSANQVCDAVGAVPGQDYIDGGVYVRSAYSYEWHHRWRNLGIVIAFIIGLLALYIIAAELVLEKKSKGEVLVYRKGHKPAAAAHAEKRHQDPEAAMANIGPILTSERTKDGVLVQQNSVFQWHDVCYEVKVKGETRRILDNVDGWVKPGSLTALMGVSGAGKTTLLDCLADRVSMGVITGEMLVDGRPRDLSFQRKTGYVQQQDLHLQTTTVREALNFSALLRQPAHVPREEKLAYVEEVIKLLDMQEYADAVVGVPGEGLNIEQRKRLTIGVELAAKPPLLLFVDEPTSGLDSQTSWAILDLLEKLTKAGQAVLCTIHQPSAMLFQRFDRLLFLAKGGKTVYFGDIGENSQTMTSYFERNGGHACPPDANPAEWMLDVIGAAPGSHSDIDWFNTWRTSPEYQRVQEELEATKRDKQNDAAPVDHTDSIDSTVFDEFAAPLSTQLREVTYRVFQQYWRTPVYLYSKLALCTLSTLFVGFVFFDAKNTKQGLQNQMFAVFEIFFTFGQMCQQTMPQFVIQRALYEVRERPSKVYSWKVFMLSQIIVELPWNALVSVFMFFTWYYPIGMYRNAEPTGAVAERGALMWLFLLSFMLLTSTFCTMVVAGLNSAEAAGNLINLLLTLCIIFCGVLAPGASLPGFWIFMYRVSPFTYLVSGMLSTGLANTNVVCAANEFVRLAPPANMTCGQYLNTFVQATRGNLINPDSMSECVYCPLHETNDFLATLGIKYADRWRNFGLMWVYIVFNTAAALFIYWLARVPKKPRLAKEKQA